MSKIYQGQSLRNGLAKLLAIRLVIPRDCISVIHGLQYVISIQVVTLDSPKNYKIIMQDRILKPQISIHQFDYMSLKFRGIVSFVRINKIYYYPSDNAIPPDCTSNLN